MGKSVHRNRPDKKHYSDCRCQLLIISVALYAIIKTSYANKNDYM